MNSQTVLLVDKNDKFLGYASREETHRGRGKRHRAFVTLLFDEDNKVLLHKRKHKLFDGFWDLTAISHPLHINGHDESYQEASDRALLKEMGIRHVPVKEVGAFNYFAKDGNNCENEYCAVLIGKYNGKFKASKEETYEAKKVVFGDFLKDVFANPNKYTPWTRLAVKKLNQEEENALEKEIANFLFKLEPYSASYFEKKIASGKKYSPLISKMYKDLADFSSRGKKMRAFLVYLGWRIGGQKNIEKILPISLAFEMTQSFFLIHDDIIDNADLRRGKPTIHKSYQKPHGEHYGESMAIVLGDLACVELFNLVSKSDFNPELKFAAFNRLIEVLLETAYGQILDVDNSYNAPSLKEIYRVTNLKTARYSFVGPLSLGALLSRATDKELLAVENFGLLLGTAFQLQDDILGVFGDEKILGKSILSDMQEGKNTVLIFKTKEMIKGTREQRDKVLKDVEKFWGNKNSKVEELAKVRKIIVESGALEWCRNENRNLATKAKKFIPKISNDKVIQNLLLQICDFVISREK